MAGTFYKKNYCATCPTNPDFVALAKAYGAEGFLVDKAEDLEATLKAAFAYPGPVIVDARRARGKRRALGPGRRGPVGNVAGLGGRHETCLIHTC